MGVKISDAQLTSAVRCRRTISVCALNPKTENGFNHRFCRFRRFNRLRLDTLEFCHEKICTVISQQPGLFKICEIGEGMWFVNGAFWEHSGCNCRTGGNMVTIRTVGKLKPAGGLTGDARRFRFGDQSPSR